MQDWPAHITDRIVTESHFGRDGVKCFAGRHPDLNAMVRASVTRNPEGEALVCDDIRLTYAQLDDRIAAIAAGFQKHGLVKGGRVALILANGPEFLIALLACIRAGGIAVPINVREQTPELAHVLHDCGATLLVHDADTEDKLPSPDDLPELAHRFAVGGSAKGSVDFDDLAGEDRLDQPVQVDEEDTAVIIYTSGTTGRPKVAMLTHLNIIHSAMHFELCMELGADERSLLSVPASHVTGLVATLFTMLQTAGCSVIMRAFNAEGFLDLAAREKVTQTLMVPAMYNLFLLRCTVDDYDLSHWRIGGYGGAPMAQSTITELSQKLPRLKLMNAYGATELTSPATILPMQFGVSRSDSVGIVVPCGDLRIVDAEGRDAATDMPGELWIRGPMTVPGYWNNPEKTAQEFQDGYWKSGDVGSRDADGFIRLHDRKKDMIIRGGYNIYSAEIENTLTAHKAVIECAAIGQPDPVLGEKLHVFVHSSDASLDADAVRAYCKAQLADYKAPDFVTFCAEPLPRNANGKIIKKDLRALAGAS